MKIKKNIFSIIVFLSLFSSQNRSFSQNLKERAQKIFLKKTSFINDPRSKGQHIIIIQPSSESDEYVFERRIDDREILASMHLSKSQIVQVLTQYLEFENDTSKSNKYYYFRTKSYGGHWEIPLVKNFTIQIEALFSFTRMLMNGFPPILPELIERKTGKVINYDQQKVHQIFKIYRRWLEKMENSQFKKITLPLEGTPYSWQVEGTDVKSFLKKTIP